MNESKWLFGCLFGLEPDTCGMYERDDESRGARYGIGGCASCVHREPANEATADADDQYWLATQVLPYCGKRAR